MFTLSRTEIVFLKKSKGVVKAELRGTLVLSLAASKQPLNLMIIQF